MGRVGIFNATQKSTISGPVCTVTMNKMQIIKGGRDSCMERIESTTF